MAGNCADDLPVDGPHPAGSGTVQSPPADKTGVLRAVGPAGALEREALAAGAAADFSGVPVPGRKAPLFCRHSCTALQLILDSLEVLPADDGLVVVPDAELLLQSIIEDFTVGQVVSGAVFFLEQVPAVLFIPQDPKHHGGRPGTGGPQGRRNPGPGQLPGDGVGALALHQKVVVYPAYHLGLLRLHGELSTPQGVAVDGVVPEDYPPAHGLELAPAGPLGDLAALLLGHAGHDGETELPVVVPGVNAVIQKEHPDSVGLELTGDLEGVHGVAGEAADLLGEDQVDLARHGPLDHPSELRAAFD